jgi:hypothetical protein
MRHADIPLKSNSRKVRSALRSELRENNAVAMLISGQRAESAFII